MKNILKLSLIAAGIIISINANAQIEVKTPPASPATPATTVQQDTTKKIAPAIPATNAAKPAPAPGAKGGAGAGAEKMAINEQGVPTKATPSKKTGLSTEKPPVEAPKKKE